MNCNNMLSVAIISPMYGNKLYLPILKHLLHPALESVLKIVCECRKSTCGDTSQCRILGLECTDLCKCSVSCNSKTEKDDTENEIDDESDDNSEQSEASDADSEEEDW